MIARWPPRNRGDAARVEEKAIERVREGPRGDDPGVAALRARAHPRCGDCRRPRPGYVGAGAALAAFVSWRRHAQLALYDPDQPQPQPAALAGAAPRALAAGRCRRA